MIESSFNGSVWESLWQFSDASGKRIEVNLSTGHHSPKRSPGQLGSPTPSGTDAGVRPSGGGDAKKINLVTNAIYKEPSGTVTSEAGSGPQSGHSQKHPTVRSAGHIDEHAPYDYHLVETPQREIDLN